MATTNTETNIINTPTIVEYIRGCANGYYISDNAIKQIVFKRKLTIQSNVGELEENILRLLQADTLVACAMNPTGERNISDADGTWKHSEGGQQMSEEERKRLISYARSIYEDCGETFNVGSTEFVIYGYGLSNKVQTPFNYGHGTRYKR